MNPRQSKQKQAWLDSEEGRITTFVMQGLLPVELGKKLLLDLQAAKLKAQSLADKAK